MIVDERLAFHNYLASDKTLASMPITDSNETNEPDLCALNLFDRSRIERQRLTGFPWHLSSSWRLKNP